MRAYRKQQLLGAVELMQETNALVNTETRMNRDVMLDALAQCQEMALEVGNHLETAGEAGEKLVSILEEYCEVIYQISLNLEDEKQCKRLAKKVQKQLTELANGIRYHLAEGKKEIVFLPYKASMWDSLESVWKAADADENCDAYVIPIPYFDKNPDGSFGEMHYEGDEYPDYVPITSWEEYDLKERRPDVIYIHNPYDDGNLVTSVYPDYYAKNLKKYTDMLVYIPYFVSGEIIYESFCVCPGTIHADRVIVQSEKAKRVYVECFKRYVESQHLEKAFPTKKIEQKFLALGSPKIDKAITDCRENYVLPQEWAELIKGKKVVLYNTGISGLLNGNEQILAKIQDVLRGFSKQNDVVLWWRPHPLNGQTCKAMRPQLFTAYQNIINNYKKEGWGIYDDTSDLHRAVACTDMYYGDDSSVMNLYGVQGKPIMLQNSYLLSNEKDRTIEFDDCAYEAGIIWFVEKDSSSLYQMEIESGKTELLGNIPDEEKFVGSLYKNIFKCGNDLWLIPCRAKELAKYNLEDSTFIKYPIIDRDIGKSQRFQYANCENNMIYMISADYKKLVIINTKTSSMEIEKIWENVPEIIEEQVMCRIGAIPNICIVDEKLYFVIADTNIVVEYDLHSKALKYFTVGENGNKYVYMLHDGKYFWLIPQTSQNIMRWHRQSGTVSGINDYPEDFTHSQWFKTACFKNGYIWVFPARGNMILKINTATMHMTAVNKRDRNYDVWFAKNIEENKILYSMRYSVLNHRLAVMDEEGNCILEHVIEKPSNCEVETGNIFSGLVKEVYDTQREYIMYESKNINIERAISQIHDLSDVLEYEKECFGKIYSNSQGTAGQEILNTILKECGEN